MKDFLNKLINDEIAPNEINNYNLKLSEIELEEAKNISFLKGFIKEKDFSEKLIPDTAKTGILNYLFNNRIIVSSAGLMIAFIITGLLFFISENRSVTKTNSSQIVSLANNKSTSQAVKVSSLTQIKNEENTLPNPIIKSTNKSMIQASFINNNKTFLSLESNFDDRIVVEDKNNRKINTINTSINIASDNYKMPEHFKNNTSKINSNLIFPINPEPKSESNNLNITISRLTPIAEKQARKNLDIQEFNNINISLNYKLDNFRIGVSLRRENFSLNYEQDRGLEKLNISEFPNLTSGLLLVGYEYDTQSSAKPFINLEYGLNRRGQIFGASLGVRYSFTNHISLSLSVDQTNLMTYEKQFANKFMIRYGLSVNF